MLDHALALARAGFFSVFPVRHVLPDGSCSCSAGADCRMLGKHPRLMQWQDRATTDEETIKTWWCAEDAQPSVDGRHWECDEFSSIGLVPQDGLVVVDIDPRNGGLETAAELEQRDGGLPTTRTVATSNGGCHLYYRTQPGMKYPGLAGKGVDLKGPGSFVLAPPSIHKSGVRYKVEIEGPIADAPAWLLALGTPRKENKIATRKHTEGGNETLSEKAQAEADRVIEILEPVYIEGSKHAIATAFGAYCKRNGKSEEFVEYVVGMLPSTDPEMRVQSALTFYGYQDTSGWRRLEQHMPAHALQALEQTIKAQRGAAGALFGKGANDTAISVVGGEPVSGDVDGLVFGSLSETPPRQNYLVPELEIGVGRVFGWFGKTNASKTLALMQLEVDLALGRQVFGQFAGPGKPVPVLRIAYEGFTKAAEDYVRLLRGTGLQLDFAELNQRLRFAEGRRHLGLGPDTREWLLKVTKPFGGGLCVIDPLVAAARGLDENSIEISQPIYDLESVSKENGVAFILAHHFGHAADHARGSSAIEGACGASAAIAKVDGNGRQDHREVRCTKSNRRAFEPFELVIRDTDANGKPWKATAAAIRAQEVSWGLSVTSSGLKRIVSLREAGAQATYERRLALLEGTVRDAGGCGVGLSKVKSVLGANGADWAEVLTEAKKRGHVRQRQTGTAHNAPIILYWSDETADAPPVPFADQLSAAGAGTRKK